MKAAAGAFNRIDAVAGDDTHAAGQIANIVAGADVAGHVSVKAVKAGAKAVRGTVHAAKAAPGVAKGAAVAGAHAVRGLTRVPSRAAGAARKARSLHESGRLASHMATVAKNGAVKGAKATGRAAGKGAVAAGKGIVKGTVKGTAKGGVKAVKGAVKAVPGAMSGVMGAGAGDDPAVRAAGQMTDVALRAPSYTVHAARSAFRGGRRLAKGTRTAARGGRLTVRAAARASHVAAAAARAVAARVAALAASAAAALAGASMPVISMVTVASIVVGAVVGILSWLPSVIGGREQDRWDSYCACRQAQLASGSSRFRWQQARSQAAGLSSYHDSDVEDPSKLKAFHDAWDWSSSTPAACGQYAEPEDSQELQKQWERMGDDWSSHASALDAAAAAVRDSHARKLAADARKRLSDSLKDARKELSDSDGKVKDNAVRQRLTDRINESQRIVDMKSLNVTLIDNKRTELEQATRDVKQAVADKQAEDAAQQQQQQQQ